MPWTFEGASCWGIDTDFFFPEANTVTEENKKAKKICSGCIVKQDCLTYALHYRVSGIWGGTSTKERERIRKQLNIIAKPITNERHIA
jgi:WhiB family redox-sensing transcriptional regulator